MKICYFTATGNSLYVAKRLGGELLSIPKLMKQDKIEIEDDAVGIVTPVYAGEMPMMVRDFIGKAKIKAEYIFLIYTYGMSYGEAFAHAKLAVEEAGEKLSYVNAVKMVDNYLPAFEVNEQLAKLPGKDVEGQLAKVLRDVEERKTKEFKITMADKAQMAVYKKMLADRIFKRDTAKGYIVNDDCIRCGICAKVCPADNIRVTEDAVEFSDRCEVCYACLHNCPKNAIHIKGERSTARFRNEHVTIAEIIEANN